MLRARINLSGNVCAKMGSSAIECHIEFGLFHFGSGLDDVGEAGAAVELAPSGLAPDAVIDYMLFVTCVSTLHSELIHARRYELNDSIDV